MHVPVKKRHKYSRRFPSYFPALKARNAKRVMVSSSTMPSMARSLVQSLRMIFASIPSAPRSFIHANAFSYMPRTTRNWRTFEKQRFSICSGDSSSSASSSSLILSLSKKKSIRRIRISRLPSSITSRESASRFMYSAFSGVISDRLPPRPRSQISRWTHPVT